MAPMGTRRGTRNEGSRPRDWLGRLKLPCSFMAWAVVHDHGVPLLIIQYNSTVRTTHVVPARCVRVFFCSPVDCPIQVRVQFLDFGGGGVPLASLQPATFVAYLHCGCCAHLCCARYPNAAGKIVSNGPYASVSEIYNIKGLSGECHLPRSYQLFQRALHAEKSVEPSRVRSMYLRQNFPTYWYIR